MARIKHVVLLKFKPGTTPGEVAEAMGDLKAIQKKLPGLLDFTWGPNVSVEGLAKGFTHGFVMTFADAQARDAYLPHPDHEAAKAKIFNLLDGGLDGVMVVDWEE
jgi:hypothetical protein